jgi:hypothetical protein
MQGKQIESTELMKTWVKYFTDPKLISCFSPLFGVDPLTILKTPFYDCHWFDLNNIKNEIEQEFKSHKLNPLTNINSTFYVPYSHNIFIFSDCCCYVSPTENGLDFQYIRLGMANKNPLNLKFVNFSLYVDDVSQDMQELIRKGIGTELLEDDTHLLNRKWTQTSSVRGGALDYSKAYRVDVDSVMGITIQDIVDFRHLHAGKDTKLRTEYKRGLLSASSYSFRLLQNGKYEEKLVLTDEFLERTEKRDIPEEAKQALVARAADITREVTYIANHIYHALNLIHKHNTQVPVLTTTKDSVFKSKRRNRRGIKPLIEWRTYEYDVSKPVFKLNKHTGYRGTHASPREHERRGHLRVMKKSGRQVWVNPCKVGDKSMGEIHKNFVVTSTSSIGQSKEV